MNRQAVFIVLLLIGLVIGLVLFLRRPEPAEQVKPEEPLTLLFSEAGRLPTGLEEPRGVSAAAGGGIAVVGDRALILMGSDGGNVVRTELDAPPVCVAFDGQATLYVGMRNHVEVFEGSGKRKAVWKSPGPETWITSIAASEEGVFVADFGTRSVMRYDTKGTLLGRIEGKVIPSPFFDVAIDSNGFLWIANTGKHTLEKYRIDGSHVASWSSDFVGCCNPSHFAMRQDGSFVTLEKGTVRMKLFSPAGEFLGVAGDFPDLKLAPDLAVDAKGRILVLDRGVRLYVEN